MQAASYDEPVHDALRLFMASRYMMLCRLIVMLRRFFSELAHIPVQKHRLL